MSHLYALLAPVEDAHLIDSFRPQTDFTNPHVEQMDNPGEDRMNIDRSKGSYPYIPDPTVGGVPGDGKNRNGWSTGIQTFKRQQQAFTGRVWSAGQTTEANPVQGRASQGTHQQYLAAGVRQQLANYDGSLSSAALSFVGGSVTGAVSE